MKTKVFALTLTLAIPGCDVFEDIVSGLSDFERAFRANPIYAYPTRDNTGIGRVSSLTVTHISAENTALDRWSTDSTTIAGGRFATHRKLEFSPDITYLGLSQYEPFSTEGTSCLDADCTIVIYDSRDGDEVFGLRRQRWRSCVSELRRPGHPAICHDRPVTTSRS